MTADEAFTAFLVAGEESVDRLAARPVPATSERLGDKVRRAGAADQRRFEIGT